MAIKNYAATLHSLRQTTMFRTFLLSISFLMLLPLPKPLAPKPRPPYYFVAKAVIQSQGVESDPSNEVIFTPVSNCCRVLTLAWDYPYANTDLFFRVYWGRQSGIYTNRVSTTNLSVAVELYPPPKTNIVLTITTTGTNLACANTMKGPWYFLNRTTISITNPTLWPVFYRGAGAGSNRVNLTSLRY